MSVFFKTRKRVNLTFEIDLFFILGFVYSTKLVFFFRDFII